MKQTRIHLEWCENAVRQFRTGVSLHSHTLHSHETLDFIYRLAQRIGCIRWIVREGEAQYSARHGSRLDLRRAWWTPPCAPYDAWSLERRQIEDRLQLAPLVSLTDHDNIDAPLSLHTLETCRDIPVSFEWTVPCCGTFFHLGVHNLRAETAVATFSEMQRAAQQDSDIFELLESIAAHRGALVVFNHPCWDEKGIGADGHAEATAYFLRRYGRFIHALELNGLRPWKENKQVLQLARAVAKPVVSGGDRHALEPNTMLDLTNARTFAEYVEQVRSGWSHVLITNQYRESFALRILRSLEEILQDYDGHGRGWRRWTDRVFYRCDDNVVRPISSLFPRGLPRPIQLFVDAVAFARHCGLARTFRRVMPRQQEFAI